MNPTNQEDADHHPTRDWPGTCYSYHCYGASDECVLVMKDVWTSDSFRWLLLRLYRSSPRVSVASWISNHVSLNTATFSIPTERSYKFSCALSSASTSCIFLCILIERKSSFLNIECTTPCNNDKLGLLLINIRYVGLCSFFVFSYFILVAK